MKLNSFGETIRRIEAERLAEAEAAVAAGWTEADHPTKCCPEQIVTPQPKRSGRSVEEVERLRASAQRKAEWWAGAVRRAQAAILLAGDAKPKFDHGMMQLSLKVRQRGMNAELRRMSQLNHAKERAAHFTRLESKYATQLSKRKP